MTNLGLVAGRPLFLRVVYQTIDSSWGGAPSHYPKRWCRQLPCVVCAVLPLSLLSALSVVDAVSLALRQPRKQEHNVCICQAKKGHQQARRERCPPPVPRCAPPPPVSQFQHTTQRRNSDGAATIQSECQEKAKEHRASGRFCHGVERQGGGEILHRRESQDLDYMLL